MPQSTPALAHLNALDEPAARAALREVCAATAWADSLLTARPYGSPAELYAASDAATAELTAAGLAEAMAGHPPIGRPAPGDPGSAREQRGMADASERLKAEMLELNLAYQDRFGHVFLICATGRTGEEMRDAAAQRLGNTPELEQGIVRTELARINRIRLTRLAEPEPEPTPEPETTPASVSTHILDTSLGRPAPGVTVTLAARPGQDAPWQTLGTSATDADGRCKDLPAPPPGTAEVRLVFATGPYLAARAEAGAGFFPEVTVTFAVVPGEHYHVPLLLNPYGYSVYRGS